MGRGLQGASLKIIWANKHLDALEDRCDAYLGTRPYTFPSELQGDLVIVRKATETIRPDLDIGLRIGDCLTNAMAALDYLIWELASIHAGRDLVPPPAGNDKPSFPLYTDPAAYKRRNWDAPMRTLYKVPADALAEVELVQPYHSGYEPLGLLYHLVNQDKHRFPLLTIQHLDTDNMSVTYGGEAVSVVTSMASNVAFHTPADGKGGVIISLDESQMDVKADVTQFVAFDDPAMPREPVDVTLDKILGCVQNVVSRMSVFIP